MATQTQQEQVKQAKRAYIVRIGGGNTRFGVYLDAGEGLHILWPSDSHEGKKSKELLPHQVYSQTNANDVPRFHFRLTGWGYSKKDEIRAALREVNPEIEVMELSAGFEPGHNLM